jgi:hypothetical protein
MNKMKVSYDQARQALMVNGEYITRGVQANLLRKIIMLYKETGRTEFDWRELAANKLLVCNQQSTGLTTRMLRIINRLEKKHLPLKIEKYDRGKYRLIVLDVLEFFDK